MASPPRSILDAIDDYSRRLRARFGPRLRLVRLYGSWARGEAHEHSDIDVAAVIEQLTFAEWRDAVGEVWATQQSTDIELAPFVVSGDRFDELLRRERRIVTDILREGLAP